MRRRWTIPIALTALIVPVRLFAPRTEPVEGPSTVGELVAACRATGATGRALADAAVQAVAAAYPYYSLWHLGESPRASLRAHRGWSHQYNTVLLEVLQGLGFRARGVHAARVRGFRRPWWLAGHAWVKVVVDGHELDACASTSASRVGHPPFVALTAELPLRAVTRWAMGLSLVPFVVVEVWRSWLTGRPVAPWVYSPKERLNRSDV